jgi:hypothetical protein
MTGRPPDMNRGPGDEPETADPVMLALLSNKGRRPSPLTAEQERLLDDWVAGRLASGEAARAEALVKENAWAAERVLERRLLDASGRDAAVPEALSARVLAAVSPPPAASPRPEPTPRRAWWQGLQVGWTGALGLAALTAILVIALVPLLQRSFRAGDTLQVAMATIGDRSALFEPSDVRMRGGGPQPPPADLRFRDVEIPTAILRDLAKAANGSATPDAVRALQPYLPIAGAPSSRIILDAALKQRIDAATGERLPVRIYDLADPRAADIHKLLGAAGEGRAWLLTLKP